MTFENRLRLSRGILLVMLALFVFAHFMTFFGNQAEIWTQWPKVWEDLLQAMSGKPNLDDLIDSGLFLSLTVFILTVPWMTGFLSRARPLLWVLRFLFFGFAAFLLNVHADGIGKWDEPDHLSFGFYYIVASLLLGGLGLCFVPRAEGPEMRQPEEE